MTEHLDKLPEPDDLTAGYYNSLGLLYASQQKHREAARAFQKALDLDSACADAFYNQALSLTALGCLDQAIDCYTHALRVRPDFADAYYNLGNVLQKKGLTAKAIENYALSVNLKADFPEAYNNLGLCLKALGRIEPAVESYNKAIALRPDYAEAFNNLGLALQDQGLWEQAIENFESAIRLSPEHSGYHYNLGFALNEIDHLDAAASHYRRSIKLKPHFADAHNNLGTILETQGRLEEAIFHFRTALEYSSAKADIYNNLGNALKKSGRIDEALEMLQLALAESPDYAEVYNNIGVALQTRGNYAAALDSYAKAIRLKPEFAEARFNRATIDLLHGNFARGWQGYEWRFKKRRWQGVYPLRHNLPRWDGSPFPQKRLLVYDEQGFGDTIQFVRYLPQVKGRGGTVILATRQPLLTCLQGMDGIDEIIDRSAAGDPAAGCDIGVPLLSLPKIFGTVQTNIPAAIPYIHADGAKVSYWKRRIEGQGFKVGLVWAGNPRHERDQVRSIALSDLASLADIPGVQLFGLQKEAPAGQAPGFADEKELINLGPELSDFSDTAAAMANLDLIVTVDTAAAHLAGALGLPVWTLVYWAPDWRWMLDRDDSPWYPTMRLFRQPQRNDWQAVIRQVSAELKRVVQTSGTDRRLDANAGFEAANSYSEAGGRVRSEKNGRRSLPADCDRPPTLHRLGLAAHQAGNSEKARMLIEQALAIDPQKYQYHYHLGVVCAGLGDLPAAIDAYRRAIQLKPDFIDAYWNLGAALRNQQRYDEALKLFDQLLEIVPQEAKIHHGRGQVLSAQGQYDKAIEAFNRAICLNPAGAAFYNSLGIARGLSGDPSAAIQAFERALSLQPNLAEAVNNLGTVTQEQGEFDKALEYFNQAIQIRPDYAEACFNRGAIHLLKGNFTLGWRDYESRTRRVDWKRSHICPPDMPRWNGSPFRGKRLCVHCEQGLGDTLQFIRYLPQVKARGGTVILEASGVLRELFQELNGVDELQVQGSTDAADGDYDMCVPLLSLAGLFETTLETIPDSVPYIRADSTKAGCWRKKLSGRGFKVGLVWAGNPGHKRDRQRSIELSRFGALAEIHGIRLYGLQKGKAARQAGNPAAALRIHNFGDELHDFADTAALIDNLDLVISVDTAVAHLAGSMAKPVWLMLPYVPDWRWMLDCDDSPWYPTMRLFRQPQQGDWDAVMRRMAKKLQRLGSSS